MTQGVKSLTRLDNQHENLDGFICQTCGKKLNQKQWYCSDECVKKWNTFPKGDN